MLTELLLKKLDIQKKNEVVSNVGVTGRKRFFSKLGFVFVGSTLIASQVCIPQSLANERLDAGVIPQSESEAFEIGTFYNFYEIDGTSIEQIKKEIVSKGPRDKSGTFWTGLTEWTLSWGYSYSREEHSCEISNPIKVIVRNKITLPKLSNPSNLVGVYLQKWTQFINALTLHEEKHSDIANKGGLRIWNMLKRFPAYPSCELLDESAYKEVNISIEEIQKAQILYDEKTDHGAKEGAILR